MKKVNGTEDHYVKSNKPGAEIQVPHDSTHMLNLIKGDIIEGESRLVVNQKMWRK